VTRRLSWLTAVLAGGVLLSLADNLAQAQPTPWGRVVAAVPSGRVPGRGLDDRVTRRPPSPPRHRPGRGGRGTVRAGTAVPAVGGRGRGAGRRGRDAPDCRATGRRRAPETARAVGYPRRAPCSAWCVQPGRLRSAAPTPRGPRAPAGDPGLRAPAGSPERGRDGQREMAHRLPGFADLQPFRSVSYSVRRSVLLLRLALPFGGGRAGHGGIKPSGGLPDFIYRSSL
jgi:hypothetical protein